MSALVEVRIKNKKGSVGGEQYFDEVKKTRYIKFQIVDGIHINIDILDDKKNVLRNINTPYLMDYRYQTDISFLASYTSELTMTTNAIDDDMSGEYWPFYYVINSHFQPLRNKGIYYQTQSVLSDHIDSVTESELENGDIKLSINKYDKVANIYIYRPEADDMLSGHIKHPTTKSIKILASWDEFEQLCDGKMYPRRYSFENRSFKIESILLECEE